MMIMMVCMAIDNHNQKIIQLNDFQELNQLNNDWSTNSIDRIRSKLDDNGSGKEEVLLIIKKQNILLYLVLAFVIILAIVFVGLLMTKNSSKNHSRRNKKQKKKSSQNTMDDDLIDSIDNHSRNFALKRLSDSLSSLSVDNSKPMDSNFDDETDPSVSKSFQHQRRRSFSYENGKHLKNRKRKRIRNRKRISLMNDQSNQPDVNPPANINFDSNMNNENLNQVNYETEICQVDSFENQNFIINIDQVPPIIPEQPTPTIDCNNIDNKTINNELCERAVYLSNVNLEQSRLLTSMDRRKLLEEINRNQQLIQTNQYQYQQPAIIRDQYSKYPQFQRFKDKLKSILKRKDTGDIDTDNQLEQYYYVQPLQPARSKPQSKNLRHRRKRVSFSRNMVSVRYFH